MRINTFERKILRRIYESAKENGKWIMIDNKEMSLKKLIDQPR